MEEFTPEQWEYLNETAYRLAKAVKMMATTVENLERVWGGFLRASLKADKLAKDYRVT